MKTRHAEIGPLIATYRGRRSIFLSLILPGVLGVLAPLGYGIWRFNYAYTHHGPVAADSWSRPWFQLATLALVVFGILAVYRLLLARRFVAVHKMGLRLRLNPFYTRKLHWEEIAGVSTNIVQDQFLGLDLRTRQQAILYPNVGGMLRLADDLENLPELVSRIKASLYPRLISGLKTNFQAGKWLYFGPIAIHKQGIRIQMNRQAQQRPVHEPSASKRQAIYPWDRVEHLTVRSGDLVVELRNQPPNRIPVSKIPNLELLLQIIRQGVKA